MKILLITVTYNEEILLPHFLKHYSFCDKIIIHDAQSTDSTRYIISKFKNCEIVEAPDTFDDGITVNMKNSYWKQYRDEYDWVIICDADEFLYHPDLLGYLENCKKEGITIPNTFGYQMIGEEIPAHWENLLECIPTGVPDETYSKKLIFDIKKIQDINYDYGCHTNHPTGEVKTSPDRDLKVLHYRYLSKQYFIDRNLRSQTRLSDFNKRLGLGFHIMGDASKFDNDYNVLFVRNSKII